MFLSFIYSIFLFVSFIYSDDEIDDYFRVFICKDNYKICDKICFYSSYKSKSRLSVIEYKFKHYSFFVDFYVRRNKFCKGCNYLICCFKSLYINLNSALVYFYPRFPLI